MPRKKTDISFKAFWDAYALKRNREGAERAWARLSDKDRRAALAGIATYREGCRRTGIAMMYAGNYLKNRRWEDEVEPLEDRRDSESAGKDPSSGNAPEEMGLW